MLGGVARKAGVPDGEREQASARLPVGGRLEVYPTVTGKVNLRPRVAVGVAQRSLVFGVELAGGVARRNARRDADGAQHDRHGGGVVVGIARLGVEQKPVHPVRVRRRRVYLAREREFRASQVVADRQRLVERVAGGGGDALGEIPRAVGKGRRQLEVVVGDERLVILRRFSQVVVARNGYVRREGVSFVFHRAASEIPRHEVGEGGGFSLDGHGFRAAGRVFPRFHYDHVVGQDSRYGGLGARGVQAGGGAADVRRDFLDFGGEFCVHARIIHIDGELSGRERLRAGGPVHPFESAANEHPVRLESDLHSLLARLSLQVVAPRGRERVGSYFQPIGLGRYPPFRGVVVIGLGQPVRRIFGSCPSRRLAAE